MKQFSARGKLLLTGEYGITAGAKGLAVPTALGQQMKVEFGDGNDFGSWTALDHNGEAWLSVNFSERLEVVNSSDTAMGEYLAERLRTIAPWTSDLQKPWKVTTRLDFDRQWGLGSSSTLHVLLAQWAGKNPVELFRKQHGGSGYDLACGSANGPLTYQLVNGVPHVNLVNWYPSFHEQMCFIYTGKKQLTSSSLALLKERPFSPSQLDQLSTLTDEFLAAEDLETLEKTIAAHELLIAEHLNLPRVGNTLFKGYNGVVKSLGGWGGDFVLATRCSLNKSWLEANGFNTVIPVKEMLG